MVVVCLFLLMIHIISILSGAAHRQTSAAAALSAVKQADLEANNVRFFVLC
jgi:hypothetical protein